jgi:uncharacterized protein
MPEPEGTAVGQHGVIDEPDLPAGDFSTWLTDMRGALRGDHESAVPCGSCTACCTSSQFVHVAPDEADALAHIPSSLLFPAPRMPRGHVLMGYDERGHCPMLVDGACSIYAHRPRTCRTYDCRVLPAAGVTLTADDAKPLIARRASRWRFGYPSELDRTLHAAVRAAAEHVHAHPDVLPAGAAPIPTTALAVLAVEVHDTFLRRDDAGAMTVVQPSADAVRDAVAGLSSKGRRR